MTDIIQTIWNEGDRYGESDHGQGEKVLVEFVSANPTGKLHLGHARGAAVGDALSHILTAAGYDVLREYYPEFRMWITSAISSITHMETNSKSGN